MSDCSVCLVEHDPAIHAATLSIHKWLRKSLLAKLAPVVIGKPKTARAAKPVKTTPDGFRVSQPVAPKRKAKAPRPSQATGRKSGAVRKDGVFAERILEMQAQGLTFRLIAERLGCDRTTLHARIRELHRSSPEAAQAGEAQRTCSCGRRKWPGNPTCRVCKARQRKEARRAA